jgi:hypothetical protein
MFSKRVGCNHERKICCDCQQCYYCHHKVIYDEKEDCWYWICPDGRRKKAGMDEKYNS